MILWTAEPDGDGPLREALDMAAGLMALGCVIAGAVLLSWLITRIALWVGRRNPAVEIIVKRTLKPFTTLLFLAGLAVASTIILHSDKWLDRTRHMLTIAFIATGAWLITSAVRSIEDVAIFRITAVDPLAAKGRKVRTHMSVLRWMINLVVCVFAASAILLTFPQARAAGAGVLASAGLVSVVIGIAAQSTLGNIFAGIQLAFSGAVRVDDVVLINSQSGKIEEITMTYVVLRCWDDRRVIFPSTYLTNNPFENWSKSDTGMSGNVDLQLGWHAPVEDLREALQEILATRGEWDGRSGLLMVTDAINGFVNVRALVSARTLGELGDLRMAVREGLLAWIQTNAPDAMPSLRHTTP